MDAAARRDADEGDAGPVEDGGGPDALARSDAEVDDSVEHGQQLGVGNTGLRGAGYVYDDETDSFAHPVHGPLTSSDSITTSHDGQVIEGVDVRGHIHVQHDDVTIRRCRVQYAGTLYAIDASRDGPEGTRIEHCDITHVGDRPHEAFGVLIANGTVRWSNIWRFQTGVFVTGSNARMEYSYVWDGQAESGTHGTGASANGGGSDIVFFRNRIDGNTSAALALYAHSPFRGVTVEDNLFDGGRGASYCLNAGDNKEGAGVNESIRIIGNLFSRASYPNCGTSGPYFNWDGSRPGAAWCNNRWADTGEPLGAEVGCTP